MDSKTTWKQAAFRGFIGLLCGFSLVFLTACLNGYEPSPEWVERTGSAMRAVLVYAIGGGVYGAAFGGASVVWEQERWGLLRQTATHYIVCTALTLPAAYLTGRMAAGLAGVVSYFLVFTVIYLVIWLISYSVLYFKIRRINKGLQRAAKENKQEE